MRRSVGREASDERESGDEVGEEGQGDDEETNGVAVVAGSPVVAVIGEQHPEPRGGDADHRRR